MATKGGPNIVESNSVVLATDRYNTTYRSDSYNALNVFNRTSIKSRVNNTSIDVPLLDPINPTNVSRFTVALWLEINSYDTGYAWHPINQWNAGGTNSATIVLYAFQDYRAAGGGTVGDGLGNNNYGSYGFYYHRYNSGGWSGQTIGRTDIKLGGFSNLVSFPRKNMFVFTYDVNLNDSKPVMYINGELHSIGDSAPYGIGNYNSSPSNLYMYTNYPNDSSAAINGVTWLQVYGKMVTANEVKNIYNHTKAKHGY